MKSRYANDVRNLELRTFCGLSIGVLKNFKKSPVSIAYESFPGHGRGIPYMTHKRTAEFVYVVRGNARAFLGHESFTVRAGNYLLIPPGVRHRFVTGKQAMVAISIFDPPMTFDNLDAVLCRALRKTGK
jgi:quercetin dioxygenase-like cupin family protein